MERRHRLFVGSQILVGAALAMSAGPASASILPENNLYLQDCLECESGVSEEQFNSIIEKAKTLYTDVVKASGGTLSIRGRWTDATVNASATQMFGSWQVNMYGGLARRAEVTADGFTMVLCHELGHHLAGFPYVSGWAANEGQSDYFATNHCSQLFWGEETEINAQARAVIAEVPKAQCDAAWQTEDAQNLCYRTMLAGKSLGDLLAALKTETVNWDTPDTSVVTTTNHAHPAAQCRLDTYMAGAVCTSDYDKNVIPGKRGSRGYNDREAEEDSARFSCTAQGQYTAGLRSTCWFAPTL
jgi:hypothetical protein